MSDPHRVALAAEWIALTSLVAGLAWNLRAHYDPSANVWRYTLSELLGTMAAFVVVVVLIMRLARRLA